MRHDGTSGPSALMDLLRRPYFWGLIAIALLQIGRASCRERV